MKATVWPDIIATYGCESWTLRKNEETCLDAFEMKGLGKFCGFHGQQRKQMSRFLKLEARKATHGLDGQHQIVDRTARG